MKANLKPRKAPRQSRAQFTCDTILEAAAQIIAGRGLKGFNTNAVAAHAGVSIGSLYQYFPNKDALMVALIEQQQHKQYKNVESAIANLPDVEVCMLIRLVARAAMRHHREDSLFATAIDHEEARLPVSEMVDHYLMKSGSLIARLIVAKIDQIGTVDVDAAARTIPAMTRAIVDSWTNLSPPQIQRAEDEVVRAISGYLGIKSM